MRFPYLPRRADLAAVGATLALTVGVLMPVYSRCQDASDVRTQTMESAKKIAIGMMMYTQDYDELLPQPVSWDSQNRRGSWKFAISPYIKNDDVFRSPSLPRATSPTTWMLNDLAAGQTLASINRPADTILFVDGEDVPDNVGHAWNSSAPPVGASIVQKKSTRMVKRKKVTTTLWGVSPGAGARLHNAPTRLDGGAIYGFTDGHVKWMKSDKVAFPPRTVSTPTAPAGASEQSPTFYMN